MELLVILYCLSASGLVYGTKSSHDWKPSRQDWLSSRTLMRLRILLRCSDRPVVRHVYSAGNYRVLANYVPADHRHVSCHGTVTYATHATVNFLENLYPLVERWRAPISVAVFAPGWDLVAATDSITYMRNCLGDDLVREFVSFHIFFPITSTPHEIPDPEKLIHQYNCTARPPNASPLSTSNRPKVYAINIFEVDERSEVPTTITQLKDMMANGTAILFHKYLCPQCHRIPGRRLWAANISDTERMDIFRVAKRQGRFQYWEPFFIGTHQDPRHHERMYYEGKEDKMPQVYIMCVLDYDFMILSNAFLCHKPGINRRAWYPKYISTLKKEHVKKQLMGTYGKRKGCVL